MNILFSDLFLQSFQREKFVGLLLKRRKVPNCWKHNWAVIQSEHWTCSLFTDWNLRAISFYRLEGQYLRMKLLNSVTLALKHSISFFSPNSTLHVHRSSHLKCSMWNFPAWGQKPFLNYNISSVDSKFCYLLKLGSISYNCFVQVVITKLPKQILKEY